MKKILLLLVCILLNTLLTACSVEEQSDKKVKDLEFTVVEEADQPDELKQLIEEKKKEMFKFTYSDKQYLYIVVGFGEQPTGGYSIAVEKLYETDNAIYIKTNFMGPSKSEKVAQVITYPYIVVKIENTDKNVVFQ